MDALFTGPSADRRRFLDRLVLAIDPLHGRRVATYEKAMRQRNRLLEQRQNDATWLSTLERQMAETGTAIAAARVDMVALLQRRIDTRSDDGSAFPRASIALDGALESAVIEGAAGGLEDEFASALVRYRPRDATAGRTLEGPHRSNLDVSHAGKSMPASVCSTGEQKALLTGIVLAHAELAGDLSGRPPILLLDEIAAHLDTERRAALFDRIDAIGSQSWMTGTDAHLFETLGERAQHFNVCDGSVAPAPVLS